LGVRAYNPLPIKTRIKETLSCVRQIEPTRQEPVEEESGPEFGCSIIIIIIIIKKYILCRSKRQHSDPDSNIIYGSNSKVTVTKSNKTELAPEYIHTTAKICNSWHMFNCKKLFKLQV